MVNGAARKMTPISNCKEKRALKRASGKSLLIASSKGFTLLEILLVLSIMAMIALVVVPNITGLDSRTFNAQVREAQSLLNYARRIAVVSGQPSTASFYITSIDEDEESREALSGSSVGRWDSVGTSVIYRDSTDREVEVEEKIEITFYPEGGSTGGSLILSLADRIASINVNPFTGRIETEFLDET
jgi:general secretion pathway protein H